MKTLQELSDAVLVSIEERVARASFVGSWSTKTEGRMIKAHAQHFIDKGFQVYPEPDQHDYNEFVTSEISWRPEED